MPRDREAPTKASSRPEPGQTFNLAIATVCLNVVVELRSLTVRGCLLSILFASLLVSATIAASATPPVDVAKQWSGSPPAAQGVDPKLLGRADSYVRSRLPTVTSLLIVRRGRLIFERYYRGASRQTHTHVQSVTKSVISALVGIALARGELKSLKRAADRRCGRNAFSWST